MSLKWKPLYRILLLGLFDACVFTSNIVINTKNFLTFFEFRGCGPYINPRYYTGVISGNTLELFNNTITGVSLHFFIRTVHRFTFSTVFLRRGFILIRFPFIRFSFITFYFSQQYHYFNTGTKIRNKVFETLYNNKSINF